jgi:hypothetical protein
MGDPIWVLEKDVRQLKTQGSKEGSDVKRLSRGASHPNNDCTEGIAESKRGKWNGRPMYIKAPQRRIPL